eukprot:s434_g7.t1
MAEAAAPAAGGAPADDERRLFALARRSAKDSVVSLDVGKRFADLVKHGDLEKEITDAFDFTQQQLTGIPDCKKDAKGNACPTRPVADVKGKLGRMTIGASLGYLKIRDKACIATNPRRIELAMCEWDKKPINLNSQTLSVSDPKLMHCDYEQEEKKRKVIGLSARAKCLVLLELTESLGDSLDAVAAKLNEEWSTDTVKRYVAVARKLNAQQGLVQALMQLEYEQGRDSALDSITALRSLSGLNLDEPDAIYLVAWLIESFYSDESG